MNITSKLIGILTYFRRTRGVGHTVELTNLSEDVIILCARRDQANRFAMGKTLDDNLRGLNNPMVLDNHLVTEIAEETLDEIGRLNKKLVVRDQILTKMAAVMAEYHNYLQIHERDKSLPRIKDRKALINFLDNEQHRT